MRRANLAAMVRVAQLASLAVPVALRAACDARLADALADGPLAVGVLAERTGTEARALGRLLRLLAVEGVFAEVEPGVFALTPLAEPLRHDHPLSMAAALPLSAGEVTAWSAFDLSVRTGACAFEHVHGVSFWDWLAAHPDESDAFDAAQAALTNVHVRSFLRAWDWGACTTVVDVGGGNGAFLAALLSRHPGMKGLLVDLPAVVAGAPTVLAAAGVADRCDVIAGSFFDGVPAGADAYVLKTILPAWPDDDARRILARVREAMGATSRAVILEAVIPPADQFDVAKLIDVHALVLTGTGHRTREELVALAAGAGLRVQRVTPSPSLTLLEAVAA